MYYTRWVECKRVLSYAKLVQTYTASRWRMWFFFGKSLYNLLWINLWTFLLILQLYKSSLCTINRNSLTHRKHSRFEFFHIARSYRLVSRLLFSFLESCTSVHKLCFSHNSWGFIWGAVGPIKDDPDPELFLWGLEVCSTVRPEKTHWNWLYTGYVI